MNSRVVVGVARGEVEVPVRRSPHGTGRHAELAFEARVVVDRSWSYAVALGGDHDGRQEDKVAEPGWITLRWILIIPSPAATATGLCDTVQIFPGNRSISIGNPMAGLRARMPRSSVRSTIRRAASFVSSPDVVELQVRKRPGRSPDRLAVHPQDEAEERPAPGRSPRISSAGPRAGPIELDQPPRHPRRTRGASVLSHSASSGAAGGAAEGRGRSLIFRNGGMVFKFHGAPTCARRKF